MRELFAAPTSSLFPLLVMKLAGLTRAAASVGLLLVSKEEPLWENEGPIAAATSRAREGSDGAAVGRLDVRITEVSGLERAVGSKDAADGYFLAVRLGRQLHETGDAAYLPLAKQHAAYNKAFRFVIDDESSGRAPELSVTFYRKQRDGGRGRAIAVVRVLVSEALRIGFQNAALTLVSRQGLPSARVRLGMVLLRPEDSPAVCGRGGSSPADEKFRSAPRPSIPV